MSTSKKALELSSELADELRKRVSSYASIVEGFDSAGQPTITLSDGTPATTEDTIFIRLTARSWSLTKDVLGLSQTVYTPTVIQIVTEADTGGSFATKGLGGYITKPHLFQVLATIAERSARVEYWETANGQAPTVVTPGTDPTQFSSTGTPVLIDSWENLYWNIQSSQ